MPSRRRRYAVAFTPNMLFPSPTHLTSHCHDGITITTNMPLSLPSCLMHPRHDTIVRFVPPSPSHATTPPPPRELESSQDSGVASVHNSQQCQPTCQSRWKRMSKPRVFASIASVFSFPALTLVRACTNYSLDRHLSSSNEEPHMTLHPPHFLVTSLRLPRCHPWLLRSVATC